MTPGKSWDGSERRLNSQVDHDMLTRIDTNLQNFMVRFGEHVKTDQEMEKGIRADVRWLQRVMYMGLGALAFLTFVSRFIQ